MKKDLRYVRQWGDFSLAILMAFGLLSGCSSGGSSGAGETAKLLVPVKTTKKEKWGLASLGGEVKAQDEWENMPSFGKDNIVRVEVQDGKFRYYSVQDKVKEINDVLYKSGSVFSEGLAAVVLEDQWITFIDTEGKLKLDLKALDGKSVEAAKTFHEGLAAFQSSNGFWGYVDKQGQVVIKPQFVVANSFSGGMARVEVDEEDENGNSARLAGVVDPKGTWIAKPRAGRDYAEFGSEGKIGYSEDNGNTWGFINVQGEVVIKPRSDRSGVGPFRNGYANFKEGKFWGILNEKGEVVVRPKYDALSFGIGGSLAIVWQGSEASFINADGEKQGDSKFKDGLPYVGKVALVKDGPDWVFIDEEGKVKDKNISFEDIGRFKELAMSLYMGWPISEEIQSDYVDIAGLIAMAIPSVDATGIAGFSNAMTTTDVLKKAELTDRDLEGGARSISVEEKELISGARYTYTIQMNAQVKLPITKRQEGWYGMETVTVGYRVNPAATATGYSGRFRLSGKAAGQGEALAKELAQKLTGANLGEMRTKEGAIEFVQVSGSTDSPEETRRALVSFEANSVRVAVTFPGLSVALDTKSEATSEAAPAPVEAAPAPVE